MQRRLAAILAADVVGYSGLMSEDDVATLAALKAHRKELFGPETERYGGRIVKLMGDGALVEFPSVIGAVECALVIQKALAEENGPIRLRIGINLGDVIVDGDDIYGDGVNVAARLEALAEPGGICISSVVQESVGNRVEAKFADAGEHEVKGLPVPIRVWRWPAEGVTQTEAAPLALPEKPSIAILPFDNMSADLEQEYFADGIVEDVTTALSRDPNLFVIARNSSFAYRGQRVDIRQVARELGVRYVVEGSVRRSGRRVRITVQLIEAETGAHVWAERYDRPVDDIFDVQDEITVNIAGAVGSEIIAADIGRVAGRHARDLKSWERRMKAFWHLNRINRADNEAGLAICREAIAAGDDTFCSVLVYGLSLTLAYNFDGRPPAEVMQEAAVVARQALELDPNNSVALTHLGQFAWLAGEHVTAIEHLKAAVRLNPNYPLARTMLGAVLLFSGSANIEAAREQFAMALRLAPRDVVHKFTYSYLSIGEFLVGNHSAALEAANAAVRVDPGFATTQRVLAMSLVGLGRTEEARAAGALARELEPIDPEAYERSIRRGIKKKEDVEKYITALRAVGILPAETETGYQPARSK
ncbi:MAG: adenylate/guanylate cyclase domain-containing protein [Hyphomicrobiaceae bacterium]